MAENSVHATQTLDTKPTIFELVAADSLQSTFEPALKRVAHVCHPHHTQQNQLYTQSIKP